MRTGTVEGIGHDDIRANPVRLAVFCTVVEAGSFARAADLLITSAPNVSLHIRALEELWDVRLFDRTRRGTHLTEAGRAAYEQVSVMLRNLVLLKAHLSDLAGGAGGMVALGASIMQSAFTLPGLLAEFHRNYPSAWVRVIVLVGSDQAEAVARGDVDLAVAAADIEPLPQSVNAQPLWSEPMVLSPHRSIRSRSSTR
jgi:DNA-binding transcriptional LysR family regulator